MRIHHAMADADSKTGGKLDAFSLEGQRLGFHGLPKLLSEPIGVVDVLTRQQDDEFFSADPGDEIVISKCATDQVGAALDRGIAGGMAVIVVDALKMVDVEEDEGCISLHVLTFDDLGQLLDAQAVVEASQRVAKRGLPQPGDTALIGKR